MTDYQSQLFIALHPFEKAAACNFTGTSPHLFGLHYRELFTNPDREIDTSISVEIQVI